MISYFIYMILLVNILEYVSPLHILHAADMGAGDSKGGQKSCSVISHVFYGVRYTTFVAVENFYQCSHDVRFTGMIEFTGEPGVPVVISKKATTPWRMCQFFSPGLTMSFWPAATVVFGGSLFIRRSSPTESPYLFAILVRVSPFFTS